MGSRRVSTRLPGSNNRVAGTHFRGSPVWDCYQYLPDMNRLATAAAGTPKRAGQLPCRFSLASISVFIKALA